MSGPAVSASSEPRIPAPQHCEETYRGGGPLGPRSARVRVLPCLHSGTYNTAIIRDVVKRTLEELKKCSNCYPGTRTPRTQQ